MTQLFAKAFPYLLAIIEALLLLGAVALTLLASRRGHRPRPLAGLLPLENALARVAARPGLAIAICTLLPIVVRLALIPLLGIPSPRWNDESSYLLAADTFASGRITNPTHPLWVFFESFHIILQPTYQSMYPPAQGLMLALGTILFGHSWYGVCLAAGLFCGALCWMLQAWLPPRWAFYGGLLAVLRLGILSYWMNSYFSTCVPALGGALVLGAWPRIQKTAGVRESALLGLGLAILANSRPFDGLVLSLPVAGAFLCWLFRTRNTSIASRIQRVLVPLVLVLGTAAVLTGYYNHRVTGSAFVMPYEVNRHTYSPVPYFLIFPPAPLPEYRHPELRAFYEGFELRQFNDDRSFLGFLRLGIHKGIEQWRYYCATILTLPLFALRWVWRDPRMRFPRIVALTVIAGALIETWTLPHYLAPASSLIYLFLVQGARRLRLWRWRQDRLGATLVRLIPIIAVVMILLRIIALPLKVPLESPWPRGNLARAHIRQQLEAEGGRHLVIVRYGRHYDPDNEWIYNRADVDAAQIVWAHDMGAEQNRTLLNYFKDRKFWLVEPDQDPPQLRSYSQDGY